VNRWWEGVLHKSAALPVVAAALMVGVLLFCPALGMSEYCRVEKQGGRRRRKTKLGR